MHYAILGIGKIVTHRAAVRLPGHRGRPPKQVYANDPSHRCHPRLSTTSGNSLFPSAAIVE